MKNISTAMNRNPVYFSGYIFFTFLFAIYCLCISKSEGFLLINQFHYRLLDRFFILFTNFGNGIFAIILMVFLLARKKIGWSLQIAVSFLVSGILVQILKHMIHSPRPKLYFGPAAIHYIEGISGTGYSSFPSGHTATVFAVTTLLSLYFSGRNSGMIFITIALLTDYSRIYLSLHFPLDVLAGSLLGVFVSMFTYQLIPLKIFEKKFPGRGWDHQSIKLR
jgi:membrane-associated phospholipid phosphatase